MSANLVKILGCGRQVLTPVGRGVLIRSQHDNPANQATWQTPDVGWKKLNFDGSCRTKTGMSTIGGAFRDHNAGFILGYAEPIGRTTSTVAELSALHRGLELVLENGWENIWIEGDPKTLVEIILSKRRVRCEQVQSLVSDINLLMLEVNNCYLSHIGREGNRLADMLARMGHESKHPLIWRNEPPEQVLRILREDAEGKGFSRKM